MTLQTLGQEYLEGSAAIRSRIRELRGQLHLLDAEGLREMQSRIRSLYEMASLAKQTGEYLTKYYRHQSEKKRSVRKDGHKNV